MYTTVNYRTKKSMRTAFVAWLEARERWDELPASLRSRLHPPDVLRLKVFQPGPFGPLVQDGRATIEGPHYPEPHRWYADVEVKDGYIIKIYG